MDTTATEETPLDDNQKPKSNWSKIGRDIDRKAGKIIRQQINNFLESLITIAEMKKIIAFLMLVSAGIAVYFNAGLMGELIASFKGVKLPLTIPFLDVQLTKFLIGLITAIFLEGMIVLFESGHNKTLSEFFTLISIGFIVYAWFLGENENYNRIVIGSIPVIATLALSRAAIAKQKVVEYGKIGLMSICKLETKFFIHKILHTFFPNLLKKSRMNFSHLTITYKIKVDSLRKRLMKNGMYEGKYFKQLPAKRGRKKKSENVS